MTEALASNKTQTIAPVTCARLPWWLAGTTILACVAVGLLTGQPPTVLAIAIASTVLGQVSRRCRCRRSNVVSVVNLVATAWACALLGGPLAVICVIPTWPMIVLGRSWRIGFVSLMAATPSLFLPSTATTTIDTVDIAAFCFAGAGIAILITGHFTSQMHRAIALAATRQEEADALLRLLATVSHEIRTPLNGIIAGADLLTRHPQLQDDARETVRLIDASARSLANVADDALDFARIDSGRLTLQQATFDLRQVIDEVHLVLQPKADEKSLRFVVAYPPSFPHHFIGDVDRMRQVLLNLIGNAIKFTDAGTVQTAVFVTRPRSDHSRVEIVISDTGIGIDEEQQKQLFNAFVQGDHQIHHRFGGSGLGLLISRRLIEAMGGNVRLDSTLHQGTALTVSLPLPISASPVPDTRHRRQATRRDYGKRVVLVEDDPVSRQLTERILTMLGCRVQVFDSGERCLEGMPEILQDGGVDLLITDLGLPGIDGITCLQRLRQNHLDLTTTASLALTAATDQEHRRRCDQADFDDFLTKPLRIDALVAVCDRLFAVEPEREAALAGESQKEP